MSPGVRRAVVIMAKRPRPGQSKTRLVPPLTDRSAAELAECFLLDALDLVRSVAGATPMVAVWPPESEAYFAQIAGDVERVTQVGAALDERLDHVLRECLAQGYEHVVALNADSPTLPSRLLAEAFRALSRDDVDVVLGPAADGGYYLIGWTQAHPTLVRGVEMSTPTVLAETLERASAAGVRVALLEEWYDVDEPADLARLIDELGPDDPRAPHTARLLQRPAES
ncbi:MAG: TIGR04282 family arsenosugar biosynthesis glycosyltransferase [Ilumatobacteraceae bacterium]